MMKSDRWSSLIGHRLRKESLYRLVRFRCLFDEWKLMDIGTSSTRHRQKKEASAIYSVHDFNIGCTKMTDIGRNFCFRAGFKTDKQKQNKRYRYDLDIRCSKSFSFVKY